MADSILIKGGRALTFPGGLTGEVDIMVEAGRIKQVEAGINAGGAMVIDASGCVVAPGLVDMHVHLREPGMEYKEDIASGSRAAARGGFSAVFCMPNTEPPVDNLSVAEYVYDRGVDEGFCMVLPHGAITVGRRGETLAPMGEMAACRAGVMGYSDDGDPVANSEMMRRAMEYARTIGALIISHSEERSLSDGGQMNEGYYSTLLGLRGIPGEAEQIGVYRDICLAEKTGATLHLAHISTSGSVELVRSAKRRGVRVTCEVAPHHFSLDDSMLTSYDTNLKMNPPLRSRGDVEALMEGLADGTIDVIATDHAPHASHEKETEFDRALFGVVGLETCLALVMTKVVDSGVLSLEDAIARLTEAPARIMSMERWGYGTALEEGDDANLVVFDPEQRWTVDPGEFMSRSRNTPYAGWDVRGRVQHTLFKGRLVVIDGELAEGTR
ncbi:MAG: dihydroorotase [Actinobacteria bacterium]|nr:dihydroorotase [Actinomycetota bacterium]MCG2817565.1 dihydroorotase [Actinomycetes bacterium]MBU4218821.1 dihydroorotase [Actinomycetota bacterium]MBU4360161.1 dihydroorotase [Actinomycetota bacterium]MBU4391084.1 dihydroorotase [Actinomycetota bacterium]